MTMTPAERARLHAYLRQYRPVIVTGVHCPDCRETRVLCEVYTYDREGFTPLAGTCLSCREGVGFAGRVRLEQLRIPSEMDDSPGEATHGIDERERDVPE